MCTSMKCPYPAEVQSYHESHKECILTLCPLYLTLLWRQSERQDLVLAIRNNAIIRSGMKSILNSRHNIEKYGFICVEFGKAHPCLSGVLLLPKRASSQVQMAARFARIH